jgi:parvulin-like peptidyl-prolyl isomerase
MNRTARAALLAVSVGLALPAAAGEILDDIVAWVNGDIITLSQYETEERAMVAEARRRFGGEELEKRVASIRTTLLQQMIDRKILVHHAQSLGYDIEKMKESMYEDFMKQQGITDRAEMERILASEGTTADELKRRLVEMQAPDEVIRFEIVKRLSVGNQEVETYYAAHPDEFVVEAEASFREIVLLAADPAARAEIREKAEGIVRDARAGADFAELARQHSQAGTAADGGAIGPVEAADVAEGLREVVFTLPPGQVSEPIETDYGFHVVKVETRSETHSRGLEEIRDAVREHLENAKYRRQLQDFLARAREESEWCVKPRYHELLSQPAPTDCENL